MMDIIGGTVNGKEKDLEKDRRRRIVDDSRGWIETGRKTLGVG